MSNVAWFVGSGFLRDFYHVEEKKRTRTSKKDEKIFREITSWIVPDGIGLLRTKLSTDIF